MKKGERLWNDQLSRIWIDEKLSVQKKKLLIEMLYRRKTCLTWKFSKIEKIKSKINSLMKIRTIFHQIWQISNFQISRALNDVISMMIKKRLRNKILKSCYDSYRNFWFLVKKKKIEKYRFVNAILKMNRVIIRDVNFFFFVNDFFKQFVDCMMTFFVNLFFNYDQIFLIETFRNLTVFQISVNLIQITIFSQKAINSVTQFVKTITRILMNYISRIALFFFDDIDVKKSQNIFENHKKILFEIRKKIFEHI